MKKKQKNYQLLGWLLTLAAFLCTSCYNNTRQTPDAWKLIDEEQSDSVSFFTTHHYSQNYNFIVTADSFAAVCQQPDELPYDSVVLYNNDYIVVADVMTLPMDTIDSVWVKIARDQISQGWVREQELLQRVSPPNLVSRFIDFFADTHILVFLAFTIFVLALYGIRKLFHKKAYIVHFNDINSFYPSLLTCTVSVSATLYATIQLFWSETWRHFYYHPSLNPFELPFVLGLFIGCVWMIIIVAIATIDDVYRRLSFSGFLLYMSGLCAVCAICYIVFSVTTLYFAGYPLLVFYVAYILHKYNNSRHSLLVCGCCGHELSHLGTCPFCNTENE